ncbi:MAG: hypothetical protein QM632_06690 [Micrococcaceae bacterium]
METDNKPQENMASKVDSNRKKTLTLTATTAAVALSAAGIITASMLNNSKQTAEASNTPTASNTSTATTATAKATTMPTTSKATPSATAKTGLSVAANDTCGITTQVTQGPYYVTGTKQLAAGNNLNYDNLAGEKIKVEGYVYSGETGKKPVAGAKIDIWHADTTGNYHPNTNGEASSFSTSEISLRGYVTTDATGYYYYYTIYPGEYEGRTRHIHTNTIADGYGEVITQLIVPSKSGDTLSPETDTIAQELPVCNQVKFTTVNNVPTTAFIYRLTPQ